MTATRWAPSLLSVTNQLVSVSAYREPRDASVPTAYRVFGGSLSADRASVTATASTVTLRPESVRGAETSPPDITVKGTMWRQ